MASTGPTTIDGLLAEISALTSAIATMASAPLEPAETAAVIVQLQTFTRAAATARDGIKHTLSSMSTDATPTVDASIPSMSGDTTQHGDGALSSMSTDAAQK